MLSGRSVLVLPVQFVQQTPEGYIGGAQGRRNAVRQANDEVVFALGEEGGRAEWILPEQQLDVLERQPAVEVNPYMLSVDQVVREGSDLERIVDPLYGQIRMLAALFDSRYALWPFEFFFHESGDTTPGRVALRGLLVDARTGDVIWQGLVHGGTEPATSPAALASTAQAFAVLVSP